MKNLLMFCGILILFGCGDDKIERQKSLDKANSWMLKNKIQGVVSCPNNSPYFCEIIPSDPRPPIKLWCPDTCRLD